MMEVRHPKIIWQDPRQSIVDFGRVFCIGVFIISCLLLAFYNDWQWAPIFTKGAPWWFAGCVILTFSTITPWLVRPIYFLWMLLGQSIGFIINRLILIVIFYFIFMPVGFFRRFSQAITKGFDKSKDTYWEPKKTGEDNQSYYRQF